LDNQDEFKNAIKAWTDTAERIESRQTDWEQLKELLDLSKGLSFHDDVKKEVDAIVAHRTLLDDPNPTKGLIQTLVAKLRDAVSHRVQAYTDEHARCLQQLEGDNHWQQLSDEQRQEILEKRKLLSLPKPDLGDADAIVESLNDVSLEQWNDRRESLASKFDNARLEAVQLLQPKIQRINLPRTTFENEADLDAWLDQVKQQILSKLEEGPVTF
jgi:hypothetical protein